MTPGSVPLWIMTPNSPLRSSAASVRLALVGNAVEDRLCCYIGRPTEPRPKRGNRNVEHDVIPNRLDHPYGQFNRAGMKLAASNTQPVGDLLVQLQPHRLDL